MLPRLQAEDSLLAVEQLRVGTGVGSKESQTQIMRAWRDNLGRAGAPARRAPRAPALLPAVGIGFRKHMKKKAATTPTP